MPVPSDRLSGEPAMVPWTRIANAFERFAGVDRLDVDARLGQRLARAR